ncbi:hypothetical protein GCM10025865_22190 [Paraoerskovia sediminicola]|uniref:Uncharacterized protein n=1 Tax=Paraoerskovia sediminicola TaxID=1138587 RepID=A0ABN6XDT8_9CELL|nr:hypothetical protein [Paraoerskovia sediminicola]BDZ42920.1 hypothetical protein GCM10025865_22190 [Paraoerskovia sediminicola]
MRLYVPATLDELDTVEVDGRSARWDLGPRRAHAVTPRLVSAPENEDEDDEGLEFVAALEAADDSLALVVARGTAPRQRLVVTVEVPDDAVSSAAPGPGDGPDAIAPSAVDVNREVAGATVVCVHADEVEAALDIEAVLSAVDASIAGGTGAGADTEPGAAESAPEAEQDAVDVAIERVTDRSMLWYDWTEIPEVPRAAR